MITDKIKNRQSLKRILTRLKKKGVKVAFTNGCFDILHYGHVKYLEDAARCADILIVAINNDASVKRLKGKKRPVFGLKDRARLVASLESVDFVTSFHEDTPAEIISYLKPDIVIKGADYKVKDIVGNRIVKAYGGSVRNVRYHKGYSVTAIIKRIAREF
ncbi:MAG: D-glycero-beta-D-manno-heptose 1-phosphate adenylyltransferase [Candidatus Omnitrophica bacterium]|nr:D-glycero-beta-D-manno-heptose 1-phosphate adenylyltransferase [Candidatus Omnitrophota bacterium]